MSNKRDEILARELAKIGKRSGMIGGAIGGAMGGPLAGAIGSVVAGAAAASGARSAARFLPTEQHQQHITLSMNAQTALSRVFSFLTNVGRIATDTEVGTSQYPRVSGIMGSGSFNLNPTLVHVEIVSVSDNSCTLLVTGSAKEGLIKQRSAQKAVNRVLEHLTGLS
jgi:hypothetical protein